MQRILAVVLVLLGVCGLVLGRLGDTVWAPPTERTASIALADPGSAVILDPGLLYVGGTEGTVRVEGKGEVSVITAGNDDIEAYLGDAKRTRITGLEDWSTLKAKTEHPDGPTEVPGVTGSDLWRTVDTSASPATIDIAAFRKHETTTDPQPYRAILLVTDGKNPGASRVSITWPASDRNAWVPIAYAAGATLAVIGLVLFAVSISSRRRRDDELEDERLDADGAPADEEELAAEGPADEELDADGAPADEELDGAEPESRAPAEETDRIHPEENR